MDKVTVIQADREAAAAVAHFGKMTKDQIRAGKYDAMPIVVAFARHRQAFATPAPDSEKLREALTRIRTSMVLLQQNSEGCALNHYGDDAHLHGMPGWLADTKADVQRLTDLLAALGASL